MTQDIHSERILIIDFGSQYTQLIARRIREIGVFSEIRPFDISEAELREFNPKGIILSGGPESVAAGQSPRAPQAVFELGIPVLGICYGMQTMAEQLGGAVAPSRVHEFGYAEIKVENSDSLLADMNDRTSNTEGAYLDVWMSHGDKVSRMPAEFSLMASTGSCPIAGMVWEEKQFYGVRFKARHYLKNLF
jgi:GMP synthase (glutamine-hydrolysing)